MTLDIKDRLYTSSEVAEILGVSLRSVYRYLEEGKLDADIKTATGRHRFSKKNILDFLKPGSSSENSSVEATVKSNEFNKPADTKTFSPTETVDEDFDFDNFFETDVVKKNPIIEEINQNPAASVAENKTDFLDDEDDLEKLFDELEKEFSESKNLETSSSSSLDSDKKISKIVEDDFDFDFDFLDGKETVDEYLNVSKTTAEEKAKKKEDDFDFDFDFLEKETPIETKKEDKAIDVKKIDEEDEFDFLNLDDLFEDMEVKPSPAKVETPVEEVKYAKQEVTTEVDNEEPEPDNWLEKFRKASEKMSTPEPKKDDESEKFSLDSFFNKEPAKVASDNKASEDEFIASRQAKKKEYYYISSLSGLKEIAQTVDKVSKKFDLDYAFTLNAGLSLHKPISPFSVINVYINEGDLEIFEDYLKLTPSSEKDSQICLMMVRDREVFDDSYELHGLYVVSNVQLRSDFIDKGLDNLAREV